MMQLKPQEKNRKRSNNKSLWVKMQRSSCRRYDLGEGAFIYYRLCIHNNTREKKVKYSKQDGHFWKKKYIKQFDAKGESDSRTPPRDKQRKWHPYTFKSIDLSSF